MRRLLVKARWLGLLGLAGCSVAHGESLPVQTRAANDAGTREVVLSDAGATGTAIEAGTASAAAMQRAPVRLHAKTLQFHAAPNLPPGTELAVLEGDPKRDGIFTIRLKAKPGFFLPAHTHPADERVTVIQGSVTVGIGKDDSQRTGAKFVAGDFYINPPGLAHYVFSQQGAIIQITGIGPWRVDPIAK